MTAIHCGALDHCMQAGRIRATNQDTCTDCAQIITILIRMVKESSLQKAIQNYLKQECAAVVPQPLESRCQSLVDSYYDLFVASLEKQDPGTICEKLGLCQPSPLERQNVLEVLLSELKQLLQLLEGDRLANRDPQGEPRVELPIPLPTCWMCTFLVGRIEATLPLTTIAKSVAKVCNLMPGTISGMCQCLMEKYTEIIVDGLMKKLGPRLICGLMMMCATAEPGDAEIPWGPQHHAQADECQACLALSSQAEAALQANGTQAEVEGALLAACRRSQLGWQECHRFMGRHQAKLSTLLAKSWSSQAACQELGACGAEGPFPGATACAQGPTYWCSSLSAARQCQAVQHCQAHIWL
ncbi:pulmonary surfactant-associated protein B isoform X2 [Hemicordylus capensis]|uniref:pulmonary surfactant-associated protein B isoform X2 n=1 Tax=Hemicordylus capensis TaxID=884348 RepID=UPI002304158C|nr:pulmonary surfactant-associated protein B isoform X2 [Hemicordylus capensis]